MPDCTLTIVGNATADPELRFTQNGSASARFGVAVNRRWQNRQSQEWEETTSFFDVVCWRDLAEHVSGSLRRGDRVIVTGRLEQRSWETDQGEMRHKVEVVAEEIGPSLRWATAEVTKNKRQPEVQPPQSGRTPNGHRSRQVGTSPRRQPAQAASNTNAGHYDEEPF
jgi:single-strand DNA-binding protein